MSIYPSTKVTMDPVHAVLIVLVLVLILVVSKDQIMGLCNKKTPSKKTKQDWQCKNKKTGDLLDVQMELEKAQPVNLEKKTNELMSENSEYFQVAKDDGESAKALDDTCDASTGFPFGKDEYGAPGLDYNSYVMSQAVDNQVIKNHGEWIQDRKNLNNKGTEFTGNTGGAQLSALRGTADGLGQNQNWIGIRGRPRKVAVVNPTQVTGDEPDEDGFRTERLYL